MPALLVYLFVHGMGWEGAKGMEKSLKWVE